LGKKGKCGRGKGKANGVKLGVYREGWGRMMKEKEGGGRGDE
jgi:hypothetical protein